jgi:predicted nucleic acid-binding protein
VRFMLDTMILDHIVADAAFADLLREAAEAGRITIVTTHVQEDQIGRIPDDGKKAAIARIPRVVVPTMGFASNVSRLGMARLANDETSATIEHIGRGHLRTVKDAIIAASARYEADAFVTEDDTLQKRIRLEGLEVDVLTFEDFRRYLLSH